MSDIPNWSTGYGGNLSYFKIYNGYLYFPNQNSGQIIQTNLNGSINNSSWSPFGLSNPQGCIVINDDIYITNSGSNYISKINVTNKTIYTQTWATVNNNPEDIVTDGTYIYTSCYGGSISRIIISPPNTIETNWVTGLPNPVGLVIFNGFLYSGSYGNSTIYKINLNTAVKSAWGSISTGNAIGLVIQDNIMYISNGISIVYKTPLIDVPIFTTFKTGLQSPFGMTYYNDYLYIFKGSTQIIGKIYLPSISSSIPPCFKEGTKILTMKGYKLVQDLRKGDMVKTLRNDYKAIEMIGKKEFIHNPTPEDRVKEQLYVCSKTEFDQILEPLVITGCHSILVGEFVSEAQRQKTIEVNGDIYLTDNKYRLPACAHHQTTVYDQPGTYTIYHLALENEDYFMNYGIYANGLLVESCSRRYLKERSNMELIE